MNKPPSSRRSTQIAALSSLLGILLPTVATPLHRRTTTIQSTLIADQLGSEYEIAFVTSGVTTATSSTIGDYNTYVTNQAGLASAYLSDFVPSGTPWHAIISTLSVAASANAPDPTGIPVFDTKGNLLTFTSPARSLYSIFGANNGPIQYTQTGGAPSTTNVWTGSTYEGAGVPSAEAGTSYPESGESSRPIPTGSRQARAPLPRQTTSVFTPCLASSAPRFPSLHPLGRSWAWGCWDSAGYFYCGVGQRHEDGQHLLLIVPEIPD